MGGSHSFTLIRAIVVYRRARFREVFLLSREEMQVRLIELIEPLVESEGFELIRLDYSPGRQGCLHLYIDCENGVSIDHCEQVSRAVSDLLDYHDPIRHAYTLEVSSPGLERPLTRKSHFERFVGEKVKVKTTEEILGRKSFSGILKNIEEDCILVEIVDNREVSIPLASITRANLWYPGPDKDSLLKGR